MPDDFEILTQIFRAFEPSRPLEPGDSAYVECEDVRGDNNILTDLGLEIRRSDEKTCQLYAGHRGSGKSTELLRLKQYLEEHGCFVVYFAADAEDVDPEDAEYTDILLACTRHLLAELQDKGNAQPLLNWLQDRWQSLKDLALTEVAFDGMSVEAGLAEFIKLSTSIREVPSLRQDIRKKLNPHTPTLLNALNEFIADAKRNLPDHKTKLVVIADNLDRIVPIVEEDGRSNHDEIWIERSGQLQDLECHSIYTVPISLVYSKQVSRLTDIYGNPQVLPMIMIKTADEKIHQPGFDKVKEVIARRLHKLGLNRKIETEIFASPEVMQQFCLMSGGHLRELMLLIKEAVNRLDTLPITVQAARRAITEARDTYRRTVQQPEWEVLAKVAHSKRIQNDDSHRDLLFRRCLMEYRYFDQDGEMQCWYDVHPLIRGITPFKEAFEQLQP
jgi:hypothetical protein